MTKFIAFLRAINVGGHTVTMERLCALFESLGFQQVESFIASGNLIFDANSKSPSVLEPKIEKCLHKALGYEVRTFVRKLDEVQAAAEHPAFKAAEMEQAGALSVGFLAAPLDAAAQKTLLGLKTEIDDFHAHSREVYWLCRVKQSESKFSNAVFERKLGQPVTFRSLTTVKKLAAKYAARR